ncbi:MAG TPA: glycosyl hydrolase [Gemmatimonadaceae bacterium]|nr:glycosyl hydrolase [Gemmatimonadaceae bacterium]
MQLFGQPGIMEYWVFMKGSPMLPSFCARRKRRMRIPTTPLFAYIRWMNRHRLALPLFAVGAIAAVSGAQRPPLRAPGAPTARPVDEHGANEAYDPAVFSEPSATSSRFKALRWRLVGPFRGGRSVAVAGDPSKPLVFYFGAVNGGVWKTANAGQTWRNVTDGKTDLSSVGAIAVAPSDPNVIYAGAGEAQLREDLTYGTGVYRSTDAGTTWQSLGLAETHQISHVVVDPRDADRVFVAAMGHAFGPNPERGVFRSTDGGKSWRKVLFVDDSTGAIDLAMDPANPRILFAAMWKFQRTPWGMNAGGGRSGLWKSSDGGDTWKEITFNPGIPKKPIGKIGIAVSPANPQRLFASIEAPDSAGGIFRSDDAGATWALASGDPKWSVRPFYYSAVTADPQHENTVYVMNLQVWRSTDGGTTFSIVRVPHGDTHQLWIDPKDPRRMINANDGGATISLDGGVTWSSIYNQPTAQFYHVTTDNQFPYRIYGAQQDNSTVSIASRSDDGAIGVRDYFPVAGCENATIAVDPRDPNVTYGGCYTGIFTRSDRRNRQARDVSVWLSNYDGLAAADVPYRFQWTFPVLISPHDPGTLYVTSQYVHRSTTEGASWERISPDLTVHEPATLARSGGPIHGDMTGTEWYGTIYAFTESPVAKGVLWAGSDDGVVHVSRDAGAHWEDVTPRAFGKFTRTAVIEASHHDAGTVYVAANRYQQDDFRPYLWRTTDFGKNWTLITRGIPGGAYTRTIREDPVRRGLLYAGTETGIYVSFDDGARWEPLQLNLPRASVRDIAVHGDDVVAATHGRAFWVLDDVSLLRQLADSVMSRSAFLFQPATAVRWFGGRGRSFTEGENPAGGAYVDFYLKHVPTDKVTLEFLDGAGKVIRSYTSERATDTLRTKVDSIAAAARASLRDSLFYQPADSIVSARAGTNRFVWNLRYPGAKQLKHTVLDEGTLDGPLAPPGRYSVRLIAGADTLARSFTLMADPRVKTTGAEFAKQFQSVTRVRDRISELVAAATRVEDIQSQLDERTSQTKDQPAAKRVADAASPLRKKFEEIRAALYEVGCHVDQCTLDQPIRLYNMLLTLNSQVQTGDYAPTRQHGEIYDDLSGKLGEQLRRLQQLEDSDLAAFNRTLQELGLPAVYVAPRKIIS